MGKNMLERVVQSGDWSVEVRGWPFIVRKLYAYKDNDPVSLSYFPTESCDYWSLTLNITLSVSIVCFLAFACEWWIRRHPSMEENRTKSENSHPGLEHSGEGGTGHQRLHEW